MLKGFTESDMLIDANSSLFTSRYVFSFARGAISLQSRLQKVMTLSTTNDEYMVAI